jgi:hypothetical protein
VGHAIVVAFVQFGVRPRRSERRPRTLVGSEGTVRG